MTTLNPRQQTIVQLARQHGHVTVEDLVERLKVTDQTVRRDIKHLCAQGILSRFHGGAAFRSSVANLPYEARRDTLIEEKSAIGRAVAAAIPDSSSVFIDIGTTAEAVATALLERRELRVVTNNVNVVNILSEKEDFEIVVCGGKIRNRDLAITGETATEFIARFQVDFAILGVVAISADGSILDFYIDEAAQTQAIIACGRRVFVVADRTKFGRHAIARVARLSQASAVFADTSPGAAWENLLKELGIPLIVASRAGGDPAVPA